MQITTDQLKAILTKSHNEGFFIDLASALNAYLPKYEIDTKARAAAFIAQCAHESAEFTRLRENLNYTADRLMQVFGSRMAKLKAIQLAGHPEATANFIYANRNGNGPESSGDGFRYRGRGAIQLTGRDNYDWIGQAMGKDLLSDPVQLESLHGAIESACAYWKLGNLNRLADSRDIKTLTKRINGGLNGYDERLAYYDKAMVIL